jgi:hypothetical protein
MVVVPHTEHSFNEPLQIYIQFEQLMHSQPSNECPIHKFDLQQIPPPPSNLWERCRTLFRLLETHLECTFHLEHIDFKGWLHN